MERFYVVDHNGISETVEADGLEISAAALVFFREVRSDGRTDRYLTKAYNSHDWSQVRSHLEDSSE